jgi:L-rhamnonate dehydratase
MKIKEIRAVKLSIPPREVKRTPPCHPSWWEHTEVANPMSKYPKYKRLRSSWMPKWGSVFVKITAEDGTWGLGQTSYGRPVAAIIDDHFAPMLVGEDCFAVEKIWDMMFRMSKPYGSLGLTTCAMSGIDLALWDLNGKIKNQPVYELLGGPVHDKLFAYATGNDTDWQLELGFKGVKLACPYGPADGLWGLKENEKLVAKTRELVGDDVEIMLDCYMAFDVDYTIRLAQRLRPYRLKWIEEFLIPEDIDGHVQVRRTVDWVSLASGEHLYTRFPFKQMIEKRCLDILQPDIFWVGGITECVKICHMADAAGLTAIFHGGGGRQSGLHLSAAMPNTPWVEYFVGSAPGVPLTETKSIDGESVPKDSYITPNDGPGFGLEIEEEWVTPFWD